MIEQYKSKRTFPNIKEFKSQYEVSEHAIFKDLVRFPDRTVVSEVIDTNTQEKKKKPVLVQLNRIGLPYQAEIVSVAVSFLFGVPVKYINKNESDILFDIFQKIHEKEKLQEIYREIETLCAKYTECAVMVYNAVEDNDFYGYKSATRVKIKVLSPELYTFHPKFDIDGNMVSFGREFKKGEDTIFEVYTDAEKITKTNDQEPVVEPNLLKKIPFVFFKREKTEWHDVQSVIERLETIYSNAAESNDRFAFPILGLWGEVEGAFSGDKAGRVLQFKGEGDGKFLEHPNAIDSLEKEIQRLQKLWRSATATPDFSFENLISIANVIAAGNSASLFIAPHLKVVEKAPMYISGFKRIASLIRECIVFEKTEWANEKLVVEPIITPFEIKSLEALAKFAMEMNGGKAMWSVRESMEYVGVTEPEKMLKEIQDEENKRVELANANDFNL